MRRLQPARNCIGATAVPTSDPSPSAKTRARTSTLVLVIARDLNLKPPPTQSLDDFAAHTLDAYDIVQGVSATIKPLGGYDRKELLGRHYQDVIPPRGAKPRGEVIFPRCSRSAAETVKLRTRTMGGA
jgi:hypothetical protein